MKEEKGRFVTDIQPDEQIVAVFLCERKDLFTGKTGQPYLSLRLIDRTGAVDGKVWENAETVAKQFKVEDYVKVKASALTYNGKLQLRINQIRSVPDSVVDAADFQPTTRYDIEEMYAELRALLNGMANPQLKRLVLYFLDDDAFAERFKHAPAAKAIHHPFIGGLLEHVLSLAKLAKLVCSHYPNVDESMLLTGVFFHDIGKIRELEFERATSYTDEGRLLGHITLGVEMVNEAAAKLPDFPRELKTLVAHMILSHHGVFEFGSPKRPKIVEAMVLSMIDDLDARVASFQAILDEETQEGRWSQYQKIYERYLYRWQGPESLKNNDSQDENGGKPTPAHRPTERPQGGTKDFHNPIRFPGLGGAAKEGDKNLDLPLWKDEE
ncbi:MAG: HD domain-containing protein [Myxococcales bacterium]|nr:MAG: HD domain-containing protein [Myxococcales bacterium]